MIEYIEYLKYLSKYLDEHFPNLSLTVLKKIIICKNAEIPGNNFVFTPRNHISKMSSGF